MAPATFARTLVLPLLLAATVARGQSEPLTGGCPQPRFTGSAPAEYLEMRNPLPPDASLSEAERIFRGASDRISCAATVRGIPDGQLFWIIRFGSPGTSMPAHPKLSDEQVWKLVAYLRRLAR